MWALLVLQQRTSLLALHCGSSSPGGKKPPGYHLQAIAAIFCLFVCLCSYSVIQELKFLSKTAIITPALTKLRDCYHNAKLTGKNLWQISKTALLALNDQLKKTDFYTDHSSPVPLSFLTSLNPTIPRAFFPTVISLLVDYVSFTGRSRSSSTLLAELITFRYNAP